MKSVTVVGCAKYCDAFSLSSKPSMANMMAMYVADPAVTDQVMNACPRKLCEVQCPYTPAENHEFELDFPVNSSTLKKRTKKEG